MNYTYRIIAACAVVISLSACQTAPQKSVEKPAETKATESDLVMMPSRKSTANKTNSAVQLKAMTVDELRGCAQSLLNINKTSIALKAQNAGLDRRKATLSETEQYLIERRLKIDSHDSKLVKEFNQEGNKYMESIKQLQTDVTEYNNQVNKVNQENNLYNTNCNNRAYRESDLNQLAPDLKNIMQNHSETLNVPIYENTSSDTKGNKSEIYLPGTNQKQR